MFNGHSLKRPEITAATKELYESLLAFHHRRWPMESFCKDKAAYYQMLDANEVMLALLDQEIVGYARIANISETCPESPMYRYIHGHGTPLHGLQIACVRITVKDSLLGGSTWFRLLHALVEQCGHRYQLLCTQAEAGSREELVLASLQWQKADDPELPVWLLRIRSAG